MHRNTYIDFSRSLFMIFVFLHHFYLTFPDLIDYAAYINPFAEMFVLMSGFMIGWIYLVKNNALDLVNKGFKILGVYLVVIIPIQVFISVFTVGGELLRDLLNAVALNSNNTYIEILKFYGLMFLMLPIVFKLYKLNKFVTAAISIIVFTFGLYVGQLNFFWGINFNLLLIYQFYFMIGLFLGDYYKEHKDKVKQGFKCSLVIGVIALCFQVSFLSFADMQKGTNYNIDKFFNTVYLAPIYLYLFYRLHQKIKGTVIEQKIRLIGKHSLFSFGFSEVLRFWLVFIPIETFNTSRISETTAFIWSIVFATLLVYLVNVYAVSKNKIESRGYKWALIRN